MVIIKGDVKEFFKDIFIFRGNAYYPTKECIHTQDDFLVDLPRYICCRRRLARLLIVDRILEVLHMMSDRKAINRSA